MASWRVLLMPPSGMQRARPRWLRADGGFSLNHRHAWQVAEPSCAALRIQGWLSLKGRGVGVLERMRLVPSCSNLAAKVAFSECGSIGCP